ncbi:MAG: MerR family transcriptional regulator [Leptolinea sp.]|nr:MerR family transcriptional regulator [Leptolinea sp.]
MEYTIGDLSKISRTSGNMLHQYHQEGLVTPTRVDKFTSRRYYDEKCLYRVEIVNRLHKIGLSKEAIQKLLGKHKDLPHLVKQLHSAIEDTNHNWGKTGLSREEAHALLQTQFLDQRKAGNLEIRVLPGVMAACERFTGTGNEAEDRMQRLLLACGSEVDGQPILLFHDDHQYKDEMDLECCVPIKNKVPAAGIDIRTLKGTRAVTVEFEGPVNGIWMGYKKILDHLNKYNLAVQSPSREVWLDGTVSGYTDSTRIVKVEIQFFTGDLNDPEFNRDVSRPGFGVGAEFDL